MLPMAVTQSFSESVVVHYTLAVSYLHTMGCMQGCRCKTRTASQPDVQPGG